ncbi:MAG: Maf family protein [Candidatus Geothermarchaeales archaeon]
MPQKNEGNAPRIILASRSPTRRALLRILGLDFEVVPSNVDERSLHLSSPRALVRKLALLKARTVAAKRQSGIVIAADTAVVLDKKILGKPSGSEEAREMLVRLSGKVHGVISGLCVIDLDSNERVLKSVTTKVKLRRLRYDVIDRYVRSGEPLGKAGAYAVQGRGAALVEWIKGCYYNVGGLPISSLVDILESMEVEIFP